MPQAELLKKHRIGQKEVIARELNSLLSSLNDKTKKFLTRGLSVLPRAELAEALKKGEDLKDSEGGEVIEMSKLAHFVNTGGLPVAVGYETLASNRGIDTEKNLQTYIDSRKETPVGLLVEIHMYLNTLATDLLPFTPFVTSEEDTDIGRGLSKDKLFLYTDNYQDFEDFTDMDFKYQISNVVDDEPLTRETTLGADVKSNQPFSSSDIRRVTLNNTLLNYPEIIKLLTTFLSLYYNSKQLGQFLTLVRAVPLHPNLVFSAIPTIAIMQDLNISIKVGEELPELAKKVGLDFEDIVFIDSKTKLVISKPLADMVFKEQGFVGDVTGRMLEDVQKLEQAKRTAEYLGYELEMDEEGVYEFGVPFLLKEDGMTIDSEKSYSAENILVRNPFSIV